LALAHPWCARRHVRVVATDGKFTLDESYGFGTGDVLTSARFPCLSIAMDKLFAGLI